ncbi:MAG: sodium:proton antiporter [Nitrososphaeraceae archaeon]
MALTPSMGQSASGTLLISSQYLIPIFLVMIFAAALFSSRTKIPYIIVLVIFGIGLSVLSFLGPDLLNVNEFRIDPRLIINFVIPPLIFEAMMKVNYKEFRAVRISALLLATVGVIVSTFAAGVLLLYVAGLSFGVAFLFAALISPTDPAIVIEIFKKLKIPKELSTLMEFEASFNDATALIVFSSILTLIVSIGSNNSGNGISSLISESEHFAYVFAGGAVVGLAIAAATDRLHALMNDPFSETALTIATVFGSVVLANSLGVSGLVAVAVAGLYFGNITVKHEAYMSLKVRTSVFNFWEIVAFLANSAAFLYLGISMNVISIGQNFGLIILAFSVVFIARIISTYPILSAINRFTREKIPTAWRHIVVLGGMRGALSVALVASLPSEGVNSNNLKDLIATLTFGVVLLSVVIQYIGVTKYVKKAFPNKE